MGKTAKKTEILGVPFDVVTPREALEKALLFLDGEVPKIIFTPNPEIVMHARRHADFLEILRGGDLVLPDGVGIVIASKFNRVKIPERVTGYDLVQQIFAKIKDTGKTVYFLGGKPGIAEKARENMIEQYPGLKIIGVSDGYFDEKKEREIIAEIQSLSPDLLLVCTGFPKQEKWIEKHKASIPCRLIIAAGGSIDGMSGSVKRAPKFFQRLGLEWLYRLVKQPSRFKRQLELPKFMLAVIWEAVRGGKNGGNSES